MNRPEKKLIPVLVAVALALSACVGGSQVETIRISGAYALYPIVSRWAEEYQRAHPGVIFEIANGGAGKGMADVLAGAVDIGMVSRPVQAAEAAQGAVVTPVAKDAVFPMINVQNPVAGEIRASGLTPEVLAGIFLTGKITTWGQAVGLPEVTDEVHVYTRLEPAGAAEMWALFLGGESQADLLGQAVTTDPGLLQAVVDDSLGIGYNNLAYAFEPGTGAPADGSFPVPVDLNGNGEADATEIAADRATAVELIASGDYPSPPARELTLVTLGKPSGQVQDFILWILTDGQEFVGTGGYVALSAAALQASLEAVR